MTQYEMVFLMRQHLSDEQAVGWSNASELLAFLDRAADQLSEQLIATKDPSLMREISVPAKGSTLPDDFVSFVGKVPLRVVGRRCTPYGSAATDALYWGRLPYPSKGGEGEELPYTREQALMIVQIACVHAQNKNEFDVSQDMALLGEMGKVMAATRGGR